MLASLVVGGALVVGWQAAPREQECQTALDFRGVSYSVYQVTDEIGGRELGVGTERGCAAAGPWSQDVAVSRVAGVDPRTAVATPVAAHVLYVAQGVGVEELPGDLAELVAP